MTPEQFELLAASLIADIFREAEVSYWKARAQVFENCKPVPGGFHGQATHEELSAQWRRADETARACRNRAAACEAGEWSDAIVADVRDLRAEGTEALGEVA